MGLAQYVATFSKDPSTKVGCVIVGPDKTVRATGYNGFPLGVDDDPVRYANRDLKYKLIEHAERNALFGADRAGTYLGGCVAYVTLPCCTDCARALIGHDIREVIALAAPADRAQKVPTWALEMELTQLLFKEAGMIFHEMPNPINRQYDVAPHIPLFQSHTLYDLSRRLINLNGFQYQATICMEEITELVTELISNDSPDNLAAETADVIITTSHILTGYNIHRPVIDAIGAQLTHTEPGARKITLLKWQKELIKNVNRGKDNRNEIIAQTAAAMTAVIHDMIDRNNISAVNRHIDEKIKRTIERNFGGQSK